jgi:hypothetical protein
MVLPAESSSERSFVVQIFVKGGLSVFSYTLHNTKDTTLCVLYAHVTSIHECPWNADDS